MTMDYSKYIIGVLALQGDYERHEHQLRLLGAGCRQVRLASDLDGLDGLIVPGGESTTMDTLLDRFNLREPLTAFGRLKPLYGTCAGMIMLAKHIENNQAGVRPLELLDVDVVRTGYGRQIHSIEKEVTMDLGKGPQTIDAAFIRAPTVTRVGKDVRVIAGTNGSPVLVSERNILASSFHTELDEDTTLLEFFLREFIDRE
jgi:5'-phosphate synthase pdxT subunit